MVNARNYSKLYAVIANLAMLITLSSLRTECFGHEGYQHVIAECHTPSITNLSPALHFDYCLDLPYFRYDAEGVNAVRSFANPIPALDFTFHLVADDAKRTSVLLTQSLLRNRDTLLSLPIGTPKVLLI